MGLRTLVVCVCTMFVGASCASGGEANEAGVLRTSLSAAQCTDSGGVGADLCALGSADNARCMTVLGGSSRIRKEVAQTFQVPRSDQVKSLRLRMRRTTKVPADDSGLVEVEIRPVTAGVVSTDPQLALSGGAVRLRDLSFDTDSYVTFAFPPAATLVATDDSGEPVTYALIVSVTGPELMNVGVGCYGRGSETERAYTHLQRRVPGGGFSEAPFVPTTSRLAFALWLGNPDACSVENGGCGEHGTCAVVGGTPQCTCEPGYSGPTCREYEPAGPCLVDNGGCGEHGTCVSEGELVSCECDAGWGGDACDLTAPGAPGGLVASDGAWSGFVRISWEEVPGASSYRVYRDGVLAGEVAATSLDDSGAQAGGAPSPPAGLVASDDDADRVLLAWTASTASPGALHAYAVTAVNAVGESAPSLEASGRRGAAPGSYRIFRDGQLAGTVSATSFADTSAASGGVPLAPSAFSASQGTDPAAVHLVWAGATVSAGAVHQYAVSAVNASGESAASGLVGGRRAAYPIIRFEVDPGGSGFGPVGLATSWSDTTAPAGAIAPGAASASQGAFEAHVALALSGATVSPGTVRTYSVRAVNAAGAGSVASTSGFRGVGAISYQWQRSSADADAAYFDLTGATSADHDDESAPSDGEARWYRCVLAAEGAEPVSSEAVQGWRLALAAAARDQLWEPNGSVLALSRGNGVIYLGGTFTSFTAPTGSFASIDATTALPDLRRARVSGTVNALAADGQGGWYIGGTFTSVDGVTRNRVARILASGILDPAFDPDANGEVHTLAFDGGTLYLGGAFTRVGGVTRNRVAAVDASTGSLGTWNPNAGSDVRAIVVSAGVVYVGGDFSTIAGVTRNRIAAIDAATGAALSTWNPNASSTVRTLALADGLLYVGGDFGTIGGQSRQYIAALNLTGSGAATTWNPSAGNRVRALAVSGSTVYAGGDFGSIGGQTRGYIAALNATGSGTAQAWNPNANGIVRALAVTGSAVVAGGDFTTIGGHSRRYLAALATGGTGTATTWNPSAENWVRALAVGGSAVLAGGDFTSIGSLARNRIAALDEATGAPTAWNPDANDEVRALAVSGSTVYAAGLFTSIGGLTRNRIAALDAATGSATTWNPNAGGPVNAILLGEDVVYVGGEFSAINGSTIRNRIAAVNRAGTGTVTTWNPNASGYVAALAAGSGVIYAAGDFGTIGGQTRSRIAALQVSGTGSATSWNPGANNPVYALAVDGSTVYAGGEFSAIGGKSRSRIAALDASGAATNWNPGASAAVRALALAGPVLYVGGAFTAVGGVTRNRLAAVYTDSGSVAAWNPDVASLPVRALSLSGYSVEAGGEFTTVEGQQRRYFAIFDP